MLSVSGKSESVNERTLIDQQKIKFHILGVAGSADELASCLIYAWALLE